VKQQLTEIGIVVEEYGGDVVTIPTSARTGEGVDTLLEMILTVAEMGNYRANPHRSAVGTVIEAKLDRARGPVATVLVENGTRKELNRIVKADVRGDLEARTGSNQAIAGREASQREVRTKLVHADTGPVTESDVMLAAATRGLIIAFNVRIDAGPRRAAET